MPGQPGGLQHLVDEPRDQEAEQQEGRHVDEHVQALPAQLHDEATEPGHALGRDRSQGDAEGQRQELRHAALVAVEDLGQEVHQRDVEEGPDGEPGQDLLPAGLRYLTPAEQSQRSDECEQRKHPQRGRRAQAGQAHDRGEREGLGRLVQEQGSQEPPENLGVPHPGRDPDARAEGVQGQAQVRGRPHRSVRVGAASSLRRLGEHDALEQEEGEEPEQRCDPGTEPGFAYGGPVSVVVVPPRAGQLRQQVEEDHPQEDPGRDRDEDVQALVGPAAQERQGGPGQDGQEQGGGDLKQLGVHPRGDGRWTRSAQF